MMKGKYRRKGDQNSKKVKGSLRLSNPAAPRFGPNLLRKS